VDVPLVLDAIIEEARRRARRRRLAYTLAVAAAAVAAISLLALRGSSHPSPTGTPPVDERSAIARAAIDSPIVDAGLVAPRAGWAMNGIGLWYTTDGGTHWRTITPPRLHGQDVVARTLQIQFVDPAHGWLSAGDIPGRLGRYAMLFRTADGGRSWFHPPANCRVCAGTISFLDRQRGFALTGLVPRRGLFKTVDGGRTWHYVARAPFMGQIEFVNSHDGWGSEWTGLLYRSTDGGRSWRRVALPGSVGLPRFFGVRGVATVRAGRRSFVAVTSNAGRTWTMHAMPATLAPQSLGFSAVSPRELVSWAHGAFWWTTDAGRTWVRTTPAIVPGSVWSVQFASRDDGWAIFGMKKGPVLVHTTDGGRHWQPLSPPVPRIPLTPVAPLCGSNCRRP
jgi:photosystem II stability/assembly factor-like uncharacterized protein